MVRNAQQSDKDKTLNFKDLEFEEILEGMLEIKPTENQELTGKKKPKQKKKGKPQKK